MMGEQEAWVAGNLVDVRAASAYRKEDERRANDVEDSE